MYVIFIYKQAMQLGVKHLFQNFLFAELGVDFFVNENQWQFSSFGNGKWED